MRLGHNARNTYIRISLPPQPQLPAKDGRKVACWFASFIPWAKLKSDAYLGPYFRETGMSTLETQSPGVPGAKYYFC